MEIEKVDNKIFKREITHNSYATKRKKNAFWAGYLPFEIQVHLDSSLIKEIDSETGREDVENYTDNKFIASKDPSKVAPQIIGGAALLFLICTPFLEIEWDFSDLTFTAFVGLIFLASIIYYFTVTNKYLRLRFTKCCWC